MSINWVMLKEGGRDFVPLPRERILHASPSRTTLSLTTPNSYPGKTPLSITSKGGIAYVTNQRVVYLPSPSTPALQSFSAPILNLLDSRVTAPWFGANAWVAVLKPVTGGGIPPQHAFVEAKLTFQEGGAYDFRRVFEEVKERLSHAVEIARDSGRPADLSDVPFEQLPAYDAPSSQPAVPDSTPRGPPMIAPTPTRPVASSRSASRLSPPPVISAHQQETQSQPNPPDEPPPAYEEAQSTSVMDSVEDSVRNSHS